MGCCQSHPNDDPSPTHHPTPSHPQPPINESPSRARTPRRRTNSHPPPPNFPSLIHTRSHHQRRPLSPPTASPGETFNRPLLPPQPYRSKRPRTRRSLDREREEFFDTAITGRREIWETLKGVTELLHTGELGTAQGILDAAGITLPDGNLVTGGAYDEVGNFYRLTKEVVSDPENVVQDAEQGGGGAREGRDQKDPPQGTDSADDNREDDDDDDADSIQKDLELSNKGKSVLKPEDTITLKARLSDRGGPNADIVLKIGKKQNVKAITKQIQERVGLSGKGARIKLAYLGKILKEGESLEAQGYKEGHVVNALVFPGS